ncbi:hypothetical protein KP509_17G014900 [Ceratopteris richardii]|nr:hypothetical protein KP509_17G014900 [Ceratopteris richardii]
MPVRLIVIDSIAALFRSDFNNSLKDLTMRTEWFFKISSKLKTYAHDYDIAVLVTNQVVDDVGSESLITQNSVHGMLSGNFGSLISSGRKVMPALGIGWSHCINTRLFLSRFSPPEWQAQPEYQHIGSSKASGRSIYIADPKQVNSDDLGSGYQISVLQQLESELPDDLLLTLSPKKCPSMNTVSGKPNVPYSYLERKTANISGHGYLQHGSLEKTDDVKDFGRPPLNSLRRKLQVIFAPHLPPSSCEFMVTTNQIFGVTTSSPVQPVCNKECKY